MSHYITYYENQIGSGGGADGVRNVFVGSRWQRGSGIGSFFAGLARSILPLFTRGLRAVGKEALRGGINVIDDIGNNINFKESVKNRFKESRDNLSEKAKQKLNDMMMSGSGYNSGALHTALQSLKRRSSDNIVQSLAPLKKRRKRRRKKATANNRKKSRSARSGAGGKKKRRRRTGGVTKKKRTHRKKRKTQRKKTINTASNDIFT